jgi:hypothetical protein
MQAFRYGEVVAVVLAGSNPQQMLLCLAGRGALRTDCLCAAQCEIANSTRPGLYATELLHRSSQLGVKSYLDSRV